MSTIQASNIKSAASASNNIVLDASGNTTFAGTAAMGSSFLRNRIINGDMRIDQRNAGASVTVNAASNVYTIDRWLAGGQATDGVFTVQRSTVAPTGFSNSALITVTTADASIGATQAYYFRQPIEGFNTADLSFGAAGAQSITLSFWVRSSVTGTFGGAINNSAFNRSYPFSFTINVANTFEQKSVTISGDTTGTWLTDNGIGLAVTFSLGMGSTYKGTAGAWSGSLLLAPTGAVDLISTASATFYLTGVQLEVGTAATPFERRQFGQELALCQRYYETSYNIWSGYCNGVSTYYFITSYKVPKRAAATLSFSNLSNSGFPNTAPNVGQSDTNYFRADPVSNASSTAGFYQFNWAASSEL
jgi:hypothetical protein